MRRTHLIFILIRVVFMSPQRVIMAVKCSFAFIILLNYGLFNYLCHFQVEYYPLFNENQAV